MNAATPRGARKPVDVGNGVLCASFGGDASWLSLGTVHPVHGFVELNALPAFDESQRGDPEVTRRYRALMVLDRQAVLRVELDGAPLPPLACDLGTPERPRWSEEASGLRIEVEAFADAGHTIRQRWHLSALGNGRPQVTLRLRGSLDRPALAEITELDPPAPTGAVTRIEAGLLVRLASPVLPAAADFGVDGVDTQWQIDGGQATLALSWPPGSSELIFAVTAWLAAGDVPHAHSETAPEPVETAVLGGDRIARGALAYVRGCTALRAAPGERAILTDHRLLQLSWTRDAYYQALLLLASDAPGDRDLVADHLRWLWRTNERPDGRWVRSHHANGRRKDLAFQADQQLYPILELADFWRLTGALPSGVEWTAALRAAWDAALLEVDSEVGLIQTAENSADDPAVAPFIAASQILLWYAATRLGELCVAGTVGLDALEVAAVAERTRAAFDRHLLGSEGTWAYATDGRGLRIAYHDANDLPTALAPVWGFCATGDAAWQATMAFAFSPANPGFCAGPLAGLGSGHTAGAWALGDVQNWLTATLLGNDARAAEAVERLEMVAFDDGMLPEAYRPGDGEDGDGIVRERHWFAWPGAAYAAFRLLDDRGELRERLRAAI